MPNYEVRRIRSEVNDDYAVVTLHYRAGPGPLAPFHIVCQKVGDERYPDLDAVYLERDDQAVACYGGARQIDVTADGLEVWLNRKGIKCLRTGSPVILTVPDGVSGWVKARRILAGMAGYSSGRAIRIA